MIILQSEHPIITAFYTFGNGYDREAQNLIASVRRFNYEHDIAGMNSFSSWQTKAGLCSISY